MASAIPASISYEKKLSFWTDILKSPSLKTNSSNNTFLRWFSSENCLFHVCTHTIIWYQKVFYHPYRDKKFWPPFLRRKKKFWSPLILTTPYPVIHVHSLKSTKCFYDIYVNFVSILHTLIRFTFFCSKECKNSYTATPQK